MGDRLRAGKPPQNFTEPPRPTQPPTLSGTRNEYRPKYMYGDALWMGVKEGWLIPYADKLCDPSLTRANLRASGISIAVSQTLQSLWYRTAAVIRHKVTERVFLRMNWEKIVK